MMIVGIAQVADSQTAGRVAKAAVNRWKRQPNNGFLGGCSVEQATQGAVAGELGARATGWIYCMMIAVNAQVADWQTPGHWTEAAVNWCNRHSINGFPGVCRVLRAEILRLRGAFSEAEEEARV